MFGARNRLALRLRDAAAAATPPAFCTQPPPPASHAAAAAAAAAAPAHCPSAAAPAAAAAAAAAATRRVMTAVANGPVSGVEGEGSARWQEYRLPGGAPSSGPGDDWVAPVLSALGAVRDWRPAGARIAHAPRVLVLHGTLRKRGFSKALAHECARLLDGLGADVRCFDPRGLPVRDPELQGHAKVAELRALVHWSEAHVWCASELHGNLCSVFKNQIDWIPLNTGSVRPTQGKAVALLQVNGGSQSFNVVNTLRLLARWMRMPCVVNQSSVAKAWTEFDDDGRMKDSSMRDRVIDVMEEFIKFTRVNREVADVLNDRYSERKERAEQGRLLTQAEKEALKNKEEEKVTKND